jgi:hypothetical protein
MDFPFFKWTIHIGRRPRPVAVPESLLDGLDEAKKTPQFQPYYQSEPVPVAELCAALLQESRNVVASVAPANVGVEAEAAAKEKRARRNGNALWVLRMLGSGPANLDDLEHLAEVSGDLKRKNVRWAADRCQKVGWIARDKNKYWTLTDSGRIRAADDRLLWRKNAKPRPQPAPAIVSDVVDPQTQDTPAVPAIEAAPAAAPLIDEERIYAQRAKEKIVFGVGVMAAKLKIRFDTRVEGLDQICNTAVARIQAIDDLKLWAMLYAAYERLLFQETFFLGLLVFHGLSSHLDKSWVESRELNAYWYVKRCIAEYDREHRQQSLAAA